MPQKTTKPFNDFTPATLKTGHEFARQISEELFPYFPFGRSISYAIGCEASRELADICGGYKHD